MHMFKSITPDELTQNAYSLIGSDWMLITAEKDGVVNTMTASWGGLGIMWGMPAAFIFIRPQRYTKEFIDAGSYLSLNILGASFRKQLSYLGSVSGRDEPKIQRAGLTVCHDNGIPFFDESRLVLFCRKLFAQELEEGQFVDKEIISKWYPNKDFHTMYVCGIDKIVMQEK